MREGFRTRECGIGIWVYVDSVWLVFSLAAVVIFIPICLSSFRNCDLDARSS
jgi:hypothetical protein